MVNKRDNYDYHLDDATAVAGLPFWLPVAGMVGHDFFKPYAVTFDFENMQIFLR